MEEQNVSNMIPSMGDHYISLPITFDYHGGRKDSQRSKRMWAAIISVIGVIISIGITTNKERFFLVNILFTGVFLFVLSLVIRYAFLGEKQIRKNYSEMFESDLKLEDNVIWGIYDIGDKYPYICRYRNGKSGVFIGLNKDVILGKYAESEYEHYEAIGDAYNLAGASKVQMIHIDYMDNVGTDERLEDSFAALADVSNPELKNILTDVYSYQQDQMMQNVTTFDVYAFLWTGSDSAAWSDIQRILSCFLDANYRSYHVLNSHDLRELTKVVFNLEEFSVIKASSNAFETADSSVITPILLVDSEGTSTKLGKTKAEKREEARQRELEQVALEREKGRRKKGKLKHTEDEEFSLDEIFGD